MALIKCPECGREISNRAEVCIQCGYPLTDEDRKEKNSIGEEEKAKPDLLTEEEKASGYYSIINGIKYNIKELLDELEALSTDELEKLKEATLYGKNPDENIRLRYLSNLDKTEEGKKISDLEFNLAKKIGPKLDLTYFSATEFLYEVMANGSKAPEEYNGKSRLQDRRERDAKMAAELKYKPKCPTCGSPDIEKLRSSETSGSILFFGSMGFANELAGKTYRCRHCKYTW